MIQIFRAAIAVLAAATLFAASASAAIVMQTLGDQDFNDGDTPGIGGYIGASGGEPAPFDAFIGGDTLSNFDATWTFNYSAITDPILSASIMIGIVGHDSDVHGSQLASFILDGALSLTTELDTLFEASGGGANEANIYTVSLPAAAFAPLTDGSATFQLVLQGPTRSIGGLPPNQFNGAGLDFSKITIETQDTTDPEIPEPSTVGLVLLGLAGLGWSRRRRR